ncbi:MAG: glycosyltransferase family 39 protein [Planctomycetes bacterium]|nr:glycosyltransferase family 39 protein [Planctomycetota bacterium]
MTRREWGHLALVLVLAVYALGWGIASRPLYHSDESRYAQLGWAMWENGDWITPRLEGTPYIDKPPLFVWLIAGSVGIFGPTNFAPRLIPFFAALAVVGMVYFAGRRVWGHAAGIWASLAWTSAGLTIGLGRGVAPDMLLAALTTGAVLSFWRALDTGRGALVGWVLAALAFMTKGPIAFFVCAMAGLGYGIFHRRFPWRRLEILVGVPVCLAVMAPWLFATYKVCPQFFPRFFVSQNLGGFMGEVHHPQPFWATTVYAVAGLSPWSFLLIPTAEHDRAMWREPAVRFLLFWALSIIVFFSLSVAKLATYVIPAMPPLCLVCGVLLARAAGRVRDSIAYWGFAAAAVGGAVFVAVHPVVRIGGADIRIASSAIVASAITAAGMGIAGAAALRRRPRAAAGIAVATVMVVLVPGMAAVRDYCDVSRSSQPIVDRNRELLSRCRVVLYKKRDYTPTYYLRKQVYHVGMPSELEYGLKHVDRTNLHLIPDHGLPEFLARNPLVAVITSPSGEARLREELPHLVAVDRVGTYVLLVTPAAREAPATPTPQR